MTVAARRTAAVDADGRFTLELPDAGRHSRPAHRHRPRAERPAGGRGRRRRPRHRPTPSRSRWSPHARRPSGRAPTSPSAQQLRYTGRAIDPQGVGFPAGLLLVVWARRRRAGCGRPDLGHPDQHRRVLLGAVARRPLRRGVRGRRRRHADPDRPRGRQAAPAAGARLRRRSRRPRPTMTARATPRLPSSRTRATSPPTPRPSPPTRGTASNLTVPDRTIDEVTYQAVVRTTQPALKAATPPGAARDPGLAHRPDRRPRPDPSGHRRTPRTTPSSSRAVGTSLGRSSSLAVLITPSRPTRARCPCRSTTTPCCRPRLRVARRLVPGIDLDGRWAPSTPAVKARRVLAERARAGEPLHLEAGVLAEIARAPGAADTAPS